jgi:hypothetical protein
VSYRILARVNALILGSTLVMGVWAATPTDAAAAASSPGWRVVASVGNSSHGELPGFFAATGPHNAFSSWECVSCSRSARADNFIRHWDGRSWRRSISLPVSLNYPRSVIALGASSSSNLWAFTNNGRAGIWNGHAWKISSLPTWVLRPSRVGDPFGQAAVFGPGNAWVFCIGAMAQPTLAAHYFRGAWRKVPLPGAPEDVSAIAADDIWVLGITKQSLTAAKPVFAAMHWNGSSWRTLQLPAVNIPQGDSVGYRIAAVGPRNVWLARQVGNATSTFSVALLHWTGRWRVVRAPTGIKALGPMAQDGHGGVWLEAQVGSVTSGRSALYHYNGGRWSHQGVPSRSGAKASPRTMTWIPGTRSLWAAGWTAAEGQEIGEILKFGP